MDKQWYIHLANFLHSSKSKNEKVIRGTLTNMDDSYKYKVWKKQLAEIFSQENTILIKLKTIQHIAYRQIHD